jgi:hypothetical protein
MSRPVAASYFDNETQTHIPQNVFIECQKEKCVAWISDVAHKAGKIDDYGHCRLIKR